MFDLVGFMFINRFAFVKELADLWFSDKRGWPQSF